MATSLQIAGATARPLSAGDASDPHEPSMALFSAIPPRHSVAVLCGAVVIYDERECGPLEEGAYYVIEHQSPRAGMTWALFRQHGCQRVQTDREVVRALRATRDPSRWQYVHSSRLRSLNFVTGPVEENDFTEMIVGRVVGLYRPHAVAVRQ